MEVLASVALHDLEQAAEQLMEMAAGLKVWIVKGEMGAGKTTLIKNIAKQLGVKETVQSPTFSIANEYKAAEGKIFHFDFYRIKNEDEAYDIGVDEYFESGEFCFIEWPDKIPSLLPDQYFEITISRLSNDTRNIAYLRHE